MRRDLLALNITLGVGSLLLAMGIITIVKANPKERIYKVDPNEIYASLEVETVMTKSSYESHAYQVTGMTYSTVTGWGRFNEAILASSPRTALARALYINERLETAIRSLGQQRQNQNQARRDDLIWPYPSSPRFHRDKGPI